MKNISKPLIVYFQTITKCDGHCIYCPFDDVYANSQNHAKLSIEMFNSIIDQLEEWGYRGRIGFLLHYEPTLDARLPEFIRIIRIRLPEVTIELATNGLHMDSPILDCVDEVKVVLAGSLTSVTSRAGNVKSCPQISQRATFKSLPNCHHPKETMCIAANGEILLCCQDWRHESVVGDWCNILKARKNSLRLDPLVQKLELQICKDCSKCLTYEEIADRVGKRTLP